MPLYDAAAYDPSSPHERIADAPPAETLDAYVAEIHRRVKLPRDPRLGLRYHPRVPPGYDDLMARNAACLIHELRSRGTTKADARADVDAFAGPFLRGLMAWSNANADESPFIARDMNNVLASLLDAIVDMTDPEWEPA